MVDLRNPMILTMIVAGGFVLLFLLLAMLQIALPSNLLTMGAVFGMLSVAAIFILFYRKPQKELMAQAIEFAEVWHFDQYKQELKKEALQGYYGDFGDKKLFGFIFNRSSSERAKLKTCLVLEKNASMDGFTVRKTHEMADAEDIKNPFELIEDYVGRAWSSRNSRPVMLRKGGDQGASGKQGYPTMDDIKSAEKDLDGGS